MNYFIDAVTSKYADFSSRARRAEYWWYQLFYNIVLIVTIIIAGMIRFQPLVFIVALALFIPTVAVLVRRLHDLDKSGWWMFISLVPLIGNVWLFILTILEGTHGINTYGDDPKAL